MGFTWMIVLYILVCVGLIALVLLQRGGNGLGALGGSSETILGSSSGNFATRTTTWFATLFFLFAVVISILSTAGISAFDRDLKEEQDKKESVNEESLQVEDNLNVNEQTNKTADPSELLLEESLNLEKPPSDKE